MWMWNVVRQQSNVLSPSVAAFRYFMIEHGEAYMLARDSLLPGGAESAMEETAP